MAELGRLGRRAFAHLDEEGVGIGLGDQADSNLVSSQGRARAGQRCNCKSEEGRTCDSTPKIFHVSLHRFLSARGFEKKRAGRVHRLNQLTLFSTAAPRRQVKKMK